MFGFAQKIYSWASLKANSRFAPLWLGLIFFLEIVFFLPMDALLLLFCLENPARRYHYATMAVAGSLLSGIVGYLFGVIAWEAISPYVLDHLFSTTFFERLSLHYQTHQHLAVFVGSVLPFPFKAITLSAGACQLDMVAFLGMVVLARSVRFLLIAKIVQRWGVQVKAFVDKHFHRIVMAVGLKIGLVLAFFWILS